MSCSLLCIDFPSRRLDDVIARLPADNQRRIACLLSLVRILRDIGRRGIPIGLSTGPTEEPLADLAVKAGDNYTTGRSAGLDFHSGVPYAWSSVIFRVAARNDLANDGRTIGSTVFTARCTLVQSAVLPSHVVCLSVCNVGEL